MRRGAGVSQDNASDVVVAALSSEKKCNKTSPSSAPARSTRDVWSRLLARHVVVPSKEIPEF